MSFNLNAEVAHAGTRFRWTADNGTRIAFQVQDFMRFLTPLLATGARGSEKPAVESSRRLLDKSVRMFLLGSLVATGLCGISFFYPWVLICTMEPVTNVTDRSLLDRRDFPGFIWQSTDSPRLLLMKRQITGLFPFEASGMAKAIATLTWCHRQQVGSSNLDDNFSEDPLLLLDRQRRGIPGTCRRFAYVLAGALTAAGLDSRVVSAQAGLYDRSQAHALVEVWIPEVGHWVLMDSMANGTYCVDSKPASLLDVYDAVNTGGLGRITFHGDGPNIAVPMEAPPQIFRHLLYTTTNAYFDGYHVSFFGPRRIAVAHFSAYGWQPYPTRTKDILLGASACFLTIGIVGLILTVCSVTLRLASLIRSSSSIGVRRA